MNRFLDNLERRLLLAFASDDFNVTALHPLWSFVNPKGDGSIVMNGTNAVLSVPAGGGHGVWTVNDAPRLMQAAANEDFELEVKFESQPQGKSTQQGIAVEASPGNYLRFDFYHDGSVLRVFAASLAPGSAQVRFNSPVVPSEGPTLYMRIARQGDLWTQRYSYNGVTWLQAANFTHALAVTQVGVYAGNEGAAAPAFSASVDYFFNSAAPISPEDPNASLDTTPPIIQFVKGVPGASRVAWATNEPATSIVEYGLTDQYELGSVSHSALTTSHSVALDLDPYQNYHFRVRSANQNGLASVSRNQMLRSGGPVQAGPAIDVFGGTTQSFGQLGNPQRFANINGRVYDSDGVASLTFTFNGGTTRNLTPGPNGTRLEYPGDFNIEVPVTHLVDGVNTIVITARDTLNNVSTTTVTVNYTAGSFWPLPYTADWESASSIGQVAQVVDGLWSLQGDGVRTVEMGYDRLLTIGEISWQDYEVTVPVTVHGRNFFGSYGAPGIGIGLRWSGHYSGLFPSTPGAEWSPLGAIGWYGHDRLKIFGNYAKLVAPQQAVPALEEGVTYVMKMRVETVPGQTSRYSLKMWRDAEPEPPQWNITGSGIEGELTHGSVLLIAHHTDATFGRAVITPLADSPAIISDIAANPGSTDAVISWKTNEPTTGVVQYGLTDQYELGSVSQPVNAMNHSVTLANLQPGEVYHFRIIATDGGGNITTSTNAVFATVQPDNTPPVVQNVQSHSTSGQITVTWTTDEPATGLVRYGLTDQYELGTASQAVRQTSHAVVLSGLQPGSTYHFQIEATDASGNTTTTDDFTQATATGAFRSDDFSSTALDTSVWTFVNPVGDGSIALNGTNLLISVPGGQQHGAWINNLSARVMQSAANEDFEIEVKFESVPAGRYANQGIIVEASPGNYIRFDFYSDGSAPLRMYTGTFANGGFATRLNASIAAPSTPLLYLRVRRQGNTWTESYSYNGSNWLTAVSFNYALAVTQVGVFAGNESGGSTVPAFTASVDYFFNTASPIVPEDGAEPIVRTTIPVTDPALFFSPDNWVTSNPAHVQTANTGAYLKTGFTGTSVKLLVDTSTLTMSAGDYPTIRYRIDGGAWTRRQLASGETSITLASGLASGSHALEVWFVATQDGGARWTNPANVLRITGLSLDQNASVVAPTLKPNRALVFGDSITEGRFILGAAGTSASDASQSWAVNLSVQERLNAELSIVGWNAQGWGKAGNGGVPRFHEPGNTANQTWRYLHAGQLRDFSAAPDYVLVNLGTNDTRTGVAGATVQAAVTDFLAQIRMILPNTPIYIIVPFGGWDRSFITAGYNDYRAANPADSNASLIDIGASGTSQVTASGNMTDSLHPNVSGNIVAADLAWAAMNPEVDRTDPTVLNVASQPAATGIFIIWNTDEATTALVEYGLTEQFELGSVAQPASGMSHAVTLEGLHSGQTYYFRIIATDDAGRTTTTGTFSASTYSGVFRSDDFSSPSINNALWSFVNPLSDGSVSVDGTNLLISVPAGQGHDAWNTNLAPRLMQPAEDEDFELEVKFDSRPTQRYSGQGLIVEASPGNYIRFDFCSDGSALRIYAATFANGSHAQRSNRVLSAPSGSPLYMRVRRQGNVWTQSYSFDGNNWVIATTFSHTLAVTKVGVFASNEVGAGSAPAFTASVDYFFNTEAPIDPEDAPQPAPILAFSSAPITTEAAQRDEPLESNIAAVEQLLVVGSKKPAKSKKK